MDTISFGSTGLKVSRLCFGTMTIGASRLETMGAGRGRRAAATQTMPRPRHNFLRHRELVLNR